MQEEVIRHECTCCTIGVAGLPGPRREGRALLPVRTCGTDMLGVPAAAEGLWAASALACAPGVLKSAAKYAARDAGVLSFPIPADAGVLITACIMMYQDSSAV